MSFSFSDTTLITTLETSIFQMGFSPESEEMFEKERQHSPRDDYLKRLRIGDLDLSVRNQALDWIWKACEELIKFGPLCIFLANNYLDRFISVHDLPSGKAWTVQLLAVACLSLAAKIEETKVLELIHLQVLTSWNLELQRLLLQLLFRFMENLTHYTLKNSPSLLSSHTSKRFVLESLFREDDIFYETIKSRLEKAFGFCKNEHQQKESKFCTLEVVRKLDSLTNKGLYLIAMIFTRDSTSFDKSRWKMKEIIKDSINRDFGKRKDDSGKEDIIF